MPLVFWNMIMLDMVLEHLCKSLELSCMAEGLFEDVYIFDMDYMLNKSYMLC
jgi:hypothetical protein